MPTIGQQTYYALCEEGHQFTQLIFSMIGSLRWLLTCFDQKQIYEVFLEPDADRYIVLVTLAPSIASFALAYFTRPFPPEDQDDDVEDIEQRFRVTYVSYSNQHKNCTTV